MRWIALIPLLTLASCADATECLDCFNPSTPTCNFGPGAAAMSVDPGPPQGGFGFDGTATVTSLTPLTFALDVRSVSVSGVATTLQIDDTVDVTMLGFCPFWCDMSILVNDGSGLVLAAWDTTSMTNVDVPGWVLTYTDEDCVLVTGDPVVPAIAAISLAAETNAVEVTVAAGESTTLGGYDVFNGQSTVNTHPVGTDIPDRWFRGAIVRQ